MLLSFLKFGFIYNYFSREQILKWSDDNLMKNNISDLFIELSSVSKLDTNEKIIEILNKHEEYKSENFFSYHQKFLSVIANNKYNWKLTQKKLIEYYNFFNNNKIILFDEQYDFWIKIIDDYYLRKEGFKDGCMLMPNELNDYFKDITKSNISFFKIMTKG